MSLSVAPAGAINLAVGHPSASLLPASELASACRSLATKLDASHAGLNYGRCAGDAAYTQALAAWLTARGGEANPPTRADRLFSTNGVSHGLDMCVPHLLASLVLMLKLRRVCAALTTLGDVVVVARPTYFLAADVFRDAGLELVEIPSDEGGGLDVDALEKALTEGMRPRLLYVVPTHANPSGGTMGDAARQRLVSLAERFSFFILSDDVYQLLTWAPVTRRLRSFDLDGPGAGGDFDGDDKPLSVSTELPLPLSPIPGCLVVSVGSFSKIAAPGLRVGWVEAAPAVLERLCARAYVVSGGGVAQFSSMVVTEALTSGGVDSGLDAILTGLRSRCDAMAAAVASHADAAGWSFVPPLGGYFLWLRLPDGVEGKEVAPAARERGVIVLDGARCCATQAAAPRTGGPADAGAHVRLCFANQPVDAIQRGVALLAGVVAEARAKRAVL